MQCFVMILLMNQILFLSCCVVCGTAGEVFIIEVTVSSCAVQRSPSKNLLLEYNLMCTVTSVMTQTHTLTHESTEMKIKCKI